MARPTKYKPEYCEKLIQHMEKGFSYESFAGKCSVSKQTIYDWEKANPEFLDAKKIAVEKCRLFWEEQGIEGLYSQTFYNEKGKPESSKSINSTVWIYNMKNRFPEEWREKQTVAIEGGDPDKPVATQITLKDRISQIKGNDE